MDFRMGGINADIIAPPQAGEIFSETNDNFVAILLTYGTTGVLLAGDAKESEEEPRRAVRTRGLKRSSGFGTTKSPELRLRAMLTEGNTRVLFHREDVCLAR
jgi:hypothetical protein